MRIHVYRLIVLALISVSLLSGCLGGGTIGTGVTSLGGGQSHGPRPLRFTLVTRVVDSKGKVQPGAKVTITTSLGTATAVTSKIGTAALRVTMKSGEALQLHVKVGARSYRSSQDFSPAGQEEITSDLVVHPDGRAELAQ